MRYAYTDWIFEGSIVMAKVITFGELLLRLSPPGYRLFSQANAFDAYYGGAEANVAVSLANFGVSAAFVSKIPSHAIGQGAMNVLRQSGVDTSWVLRGGERMGIYFLEQGASQRPSRIIYDRKYSSITEVSSDEFSWRDILEGAKWFHFTGITPALGENVAEICREACKTAKKMGVTVSCDLNYRKKLWSCEKAREVMTSLMKYVDVCIANEADAKDVFGLELPGTNVEKGILDINGYKYVAKQMKQQFDLKTVAITLRKSITASENNWSGILYDGENDLFYESQEYPIHLVDRVGGGDSFAAGLIYSLLKNKDMQQAVDFAAAASCLKQTIPGDMNYVTISEVEALASGSASGRVQR